MDFKVISRGARERPESTAVPVSIEPATESGPSRGFPVLLLFLAAVAVGLLMLATASIAFAAPAAGTGLAASGAPRPPMLLPDGASVSGGSAASAPGVTASDLASARWIIGAEPGAKAARIAGSHDAARVAPGLGVYRVPRARATTFARRLDRAGLLRYAEPDVAITPAAYPSDLMTDLQWWLNRIVRPNEVTPPAVGPASPLIGLIEQGIDRNHPDLVQANLTGATSVSPELDSHGTAIAAILGSPGEGAGIRGVLPGARMRHFPAGATCSTAADAVVSAARSRVSVINMSYTLPATLCYSHYLATELAVSRDVLPVAAAGNSGATGNALLRPGSDPHVLSVSAIDAEGLVGSFASRNSAVDITAPGVDVFAPTVTTAERADGGSGAVYTWGGMSGTSFSAPMVTAAAAWLRQVRPTLSARQVSRALTSTATDLGAPGRDQEYGEGLLDVEAALAARRPYDDPHEPNDDIPLLKGKGWLKKAKHTWKRRKRHRVTRFRATLSRSKDPADVYRVRVPARKRILVTAVQLEGDVRITALRPSTKSLTRTRKKVIVTSDRPYPKIEGIRVRNLRRKSKDIWIAVTPGSAGTADYAAYRLTIRQN